jgi:RimJ/RimL family protein N-acetyltransferase
MKLITERLILRELSMNDSKELARYTNNPDFCRFIPPIRLPYGLKDAKDYLKRHINDYKKKDRNGFVLAIEHKSGKKIVGIIEISYNKLDNIAQIDYALNSEYHRQGIMTEAETAMINFAFNKLKVRKITCPILTENIASNALAKKLGFKLEGTLREHVKVKSTGKIHDENLYGLLKGEWKR